MDWIEQIKPVFFEVCKETGLHLGHDTHYDAQNFVYSVVKDNVIHRLDFQPLEGSIQVTKYTDTYPAFPRVLRFLHNTVPLFPNTGKVSHENLEKLMPPFDTGLLKEKILGLVRNAL